ncbi:MAG: FAD-linked oxidase C-terminal domain-containing protein, partial [Pyrinomonadaceae bacterium]
SRAVSAVIAEGIIPAGLEMVDGATIRAVEASVFAAGLPTDAEAALLVELDGLEAGMDEEVEHVRAICMSNGARSVKLAADELERKRLWAARKGAFGAMGRITPDILIQDAVVPRSRLPEVLAATYQIGARHGLRVANVFHAGDGNLHPLVCFDSRDAAQVERVHEAGREIMETCVRAGGTITGEHGVGLDKSDYLPLVFSDEDMRTMLSVRAAFDPAGLCNPGKIIPVLKGCGEARAVAEVKSAARGTIDGNGSNVRSTQFKSEAPALYVATPEHTQTTRGPLDPSTALARLVGREHVGVVTTGDHTSALVVEPSTFEEVCEVLRLAESERWTVAPAGACTWLDAGEARRDSNIILKTTRMSRLVAHEPADLVATAEAGLTLADFNREVGRAGQWLPLDPPGAEAATLGGVVATGTAGAQGFGYGAPRSHVLGMRVALSGGRLIKAGGRVVKNVAGYDLCKLFTGSHGTLGVILEITFKLRPRPRREATLVARSSDPRALIEAARALTGSQLLPVAVELLSPTLAEEVGVINDGDDFCMLARFAGTEGAVEYQLARAAELFGGTAKKGTAARVEDDDGLWTRLSSANSRDSVPLVWRASVLPSALDSMLSRLGDDDYGRVLRWHASAGDGRLRVFDESQEHDRTIIFLSEMRKAARAAGGSLVVECAPAALKRELGAWGLSESAAFLMQRLKEQLDPTDTFTPGLFG